MDRDSRVIDCRRATPEDLSFVLKSWVDVYRMSHFAGPIPMREFQIDNEAGERMMVTYRDVMYGAVRAISRRPGIEIYVAFKPGESPPDDAYGWICVETGVQIRMREYDYKTRGMKTVMKPAPQKVVHFAFVKSDFRRNKLKIGRYLFEQAGVDPAKPLVCTFKTSASARLIMLGKVARVEFHPEVARFPKNDSEETNDDE